MHELIVSTGPALIATAIFIAVVFILGLWLVSLLVRDSSIVDFCWGPTCVAVAWIAHVASGQPMNPRLWLVLVAVTLWGMRLGIYIARRNWGEEDRRYARLRRDAAARGRNYALLSLRLVFLLQGAASWIVFLPLIVAIAGPGPAQPGWFTWIGGAVWLAGFGIEAVADAQMARFRARRSEPDEVMSRGLWRYSRHPNYFGELLVQWAYFLFACEIGPPALVAIVGPLAFSYLIIGPMGANLLERRLTTIKPAYADYVARTSALIPWPPRR